jgi:hypothetical protein
VWNEQKKTAAWISGQKLIRLNRDEKQEVRRLIYRGRMKGRKQRRLI